MALKKSYSKDKKTCNVTFTVSPEAAQESNLLLNLVKNISSDIFLTARAGRTIGLLTNIFLPHLAQQITQSLFAKLIA